MKKNRFSTLLFILSALLVGCSVKRDDRALIKRCSGVTIPFEAMILYSYEATGFGNQGHGSHYAVFSFAEEPIDFFTSEFSYGGELSYWDDDVPVYKPIVSGVLSFSEERMRKDHEDKIDEITTMLKIPENKLIPGNKIIGTTKKN